jgi:hypothetical protein
VVWKYILLRLLLKNKRFSNIILEVTHRKHCLYQKMADLAQRNEFLSFARKVAGSVTVQTFVCMNILFLLGIFYVNIICKYLQVKFKKKDISPLCFNNL